jgi:mRNA interferase RelE/StbE
MYKITYAKQVKKSLESFPKKDTIAILEKIELLAENPRPNGVKSLQGNLSDFYRIRVGNYRVIYSIEDEILTVYIVKVAHRKDIYDV